MRSVAELAAEMNGLGLKPKPQTFADGRTVKLQYYPDGPSRTS